MFDKCPYRIQICYDCPFDDCVATYKDIERQESACKQKQLEERSILIKQMREQGHKIKDIADKLNINRSTVSHVLNYGHP